MLIRILEIPNSTGEFCFGGGNPQTWLEVDWFREDPETFGDTPLLSTAEGREFITEHIRKNKYFNPEKAYLVLHQDHTFTINYKAP